MREQLLFAARRLLGYMDAQATVDAAAELLARGIETDSIVYLAGLLRNPNPWEVDSLAAKAIVDMGLAGMTVDHACWIVVCDTAQRIMAGTINPRVGAGIIWSHASDLDYPDILGSFGYLWSDYGEDPSATAWFDSNIIAQAAKLVAEPACAAAIARS
jgi:hypothetical protein